MLVIGADSETCDGPPFTFQFYSDDFRIKGKPVREVVWINPKRASKDFIKFLDSLPFIDTASYVVYAHNLNFDLVSFFYDIKDVLLDEEIEFEVKAWKITGVFGRPTFLKATRQTGKRITVWIIDTGAFYTGTLAKLAELHCPHLPKLSAPPDLGKIVYPQTHRKFGAYALRDAEVAYHIGRSIERLHTEWDVQQSVSVPHFAARVFRRDFMQAAIPLPPMRIVYAALHSYHGGKNNITCEPGFHRRVYSLDIASAYPFAMAGLPSFSDPRLFRECTGDASVSRVPEHGIYRIWGTTKDCPWPIIYTHTFKPIRGECKGVWVTGFELNEAFRAREIRLDRLEGYYYESWNDHTPSPFPAFVKEFFRLKDAAPTPIDRTFYKLVLNSLYGKFIQTHKKPKQGSDLGCDVDDKRLYQELDLVAGGLFNPFIASIITGHTRAYLHRLEHKYRALHASTDGIFTTTRPRQKDGLGGLTIDTYGDLLIFRNKLYIFYTGVKGDNRKSSIFKGKYISKFALHGFRGNVAALEHMAVSGSRSYHYIKVNKLRESRQRGLQVNRFQDYTAELKI